MIVERKKNEIIFRLPADTCIDDLQDMMDFLSYKEIAQKSKATQKQVDDLVKSVKKGRWNRAKAKISK